MLLHLLFGVDSIFAYHKLEKISINKSLDKNNFNIYDRYVEDGVK